LHDLFKLKLNSDKRLKVSTSFFKAGCVGGDVSVPYKLDSLLKAVGV